MQNEHTHTHWFVFIDLFLVLFVCPFESICKILQMKWSFTSMHAQPAEQLFTQNRKGAKSKRRTETLLDEHAAGKAGTRRHRYTNNNCQLPTANLPALSCSWLLCCTAPVKGPPRRAQTPWQ